MQVTDAMYDDSPDSTADDQPPATRLAWATASALRLGNLSEARAHCDHALSIARAEGSDAGVASVQTILGRVLLAQGDPDAALGVLQAALGVQRSEGLERAYATTLLELGTLHVTTGALDLAQQHFMEALAFFARARSAISEAEAQLGIAMVHHAAGRLEPARRHLNVAMGVATRGDDATLRARCLEVSGALHHESARRLRARTNLSEAEALWHRLSDRPGEARCRLALARLDLDDGEAALERLEGLESDSSVAGYPWVLGRVLCLQGALLGQRGDRLAYSVLARGAALLDSHPLLKHLPPVEQGHLDLARGADDAAYGRLSAVPTEALRSVPVRLALFSLRHRLGLALESRS